MSFIKFKLKFNFIFLSSLIATGITAAQKAEILEAHNFLRSQVAQGQVPGQPGAQNMREMVWDDELAVKAQDWANQCIFEHDPNRYIGKIISLSLFFIFLFTFLQLFANRMFNISYRTLIFLYN